MIRPSTILLFVLVLLMGCSPKKEKEVGTDEELKSSQSDQPTEVNVKVLKWEVFHYELVSNGRIRAQKKADLKFQTSGIVTNIYVQNGDKVVKGQKLASLDVFRLKKELEQARDNLERAKLDLQDVLIGQGYSPKNMEAIPAEVLNIAKVKSNYDQRRIGFEIAEYNLKTASLVAPFAGVVANLYSKSSNEVNGSEPFCTIVDVAHPEVVFPILENELPLVQKNDVVLVSAFSNHSETFQGKLKEINPCIDKDGMIRIMAEVTNSKNGLLDGMNVRVRVQRATDKQLLIPKSALVLRNGRKVVFTCKNGLAQWVYVETGLENSESYVVTEGLQEGDSLIYEGNINLAHESPIVVK